ncbi:response regulator transcription factor [Brachybacterium phenoliresistens]|uniref:LuxR family transcriptional regulator n=1 Tax=Brachybacterium phenoliresistens TaxID=396014 RepID=Z9JUX1_9MICO|nr:response regulator transcription factor [Brachybacterium phenoliresistens]EWS81994.1 LuxR family transcriptional regulator [Brachybacterium phenoliresistens]
MSAQAPPPSDPPITVLVVDDDRWTTRAIAAVLEADPSLQVLGVEHSGEDAVDAFRALRPQIVLMDVNMAPGMSGIDATAKILQEDPRATVLILTTISPGPGIARALEAGAMAVVTKTAPPEALVAAVRLAAAGESPSLLKNLAADIAISGDLQPDSPARFPALTEREHATLQLICEGMDYQTIAARQHVAETTVKTHARSLRDKLGAQSLAQLVVRAVQYRLYSPS